MAKKAKKRATKKSVRTGRARQAPKLLNDLFLDTLKDIYFAEKQILKALPAKWPAPPNPKKSQGSGFCSIGSETQGQIERLEQVSNLSESRLAGKTSEAIQGIIAESEEIMEDFEDSVCARRWPDFLGAGGRALRDRPLRHACAPGPRSSA